MTAPHHIRRHADGKIDFRFHTARGVELRAQAKRDASGPRAFFGLLLIATIMLGFSVLSTSEPEHRISILQQQAQSLHMRIDKLSATDPQTWWQHYGRGTILSRDSAISDLQRQLSETEAAIATARRQLARRQIAAGASTGVAPRRE